MSKTTQINKDTVIRKWIILDATDQILGRLATQAALLLRGKHKPVFTPHLDLGDHVIVINAEKIKLSGNKLKGKLYQHHTGYPGGLKTIAAGKLLAENPEKLVFKAIEGMIPHNTLGSEIVKKLRVYKGSDHPHQAQQPEQLTLK
ncbi:MAG: 50S ribosomal protein L13 [Nitrospirae bacterium]|nr:50S ribosomal protein L13 [Nitrospirota bacterium]MBI3594900.1 50S ribosomal protein L13 [Nitrospirota bacterium]